MLEAGYESVVLTGSDLPRMGKAHLQSGFFALEEKDVVIGPTSDGGYYLIGMKKPNREVFRVEGYGGSSAFENTVTAAERAGLSLGTALPCDDVDTPEDLRSLIRWLDPESHTAHYLKQEGMMP